MSVYPEALGGGAGTCVRVDVDPVGLDFGPPVRGRRGTARMTEERLITMTPTEV